MNTHLYPDCQRKKLLSICAGMECHFEFGLLLLLSGFNFDQSANLSPQNHGLWWWLLLPLSVPNGAARILRDLSMTKKMLANFLNTIAMGSKVSLKTLWFFHTHQQGLESVSTKFDTCLQVLLQIRLSPLKVSKKTSLKKSSVDVRGLSENLVYFESVLQDMEREVIPLSVAASEGISFVIETAALQFKWHELGTARIYGVFATFQAKLFHQMLFVYWNT